MKGVVGWGEEYYQNSVINRFKYSDISSKAKIITNELLKAANYNTTKIAKQIITYPDCKLAKQIIILSNHNNLNYHIMYYDQSQTKI